MNPTPYKGPARPGDLAIYNPPKFKQAKGYCVLIEEATSSSVKVSYLDSHQDDLVIDPIPLEHVILTGKPAEWLCELYKPTPMKLAEALRKEREFPEFDKPKQKGVKKPKKAAAQTALDKITTMSKQDLAKLRASVLAHLAKETNK